MFTILNSVVRRCRYLAHLPEHMFYQPNFTADRVRTNKHFARTAPYRYAVFNTQCIRAYYRKQYVDVKTVFGVIQCNGLNVSPVFKYNSTTNLNVFRRVRKSHVLQLIRQ